MIRRSLTPPSITSPRVTAGTLGRAASGLRTAAGGLRRCPVCQGEPAGPGGVCLRCEANLVSAVAALPPPGGPLYWLGAYAGPWLRLIKALKYDRDRRLAALLGGLLAARLLSTDYRPTLVTHVPASRERLKERGFDQAQALAVALTARLQASAAAPTPSLRATTDSLAAPLTTGAPTAAPATNRQVLFRSQGSRSQGRLSRAERAVNAGLSFSARACSNQRILLVDDVLTTGATMRACVAALDSAAAAEVWIAVVARTSEVRH